MTVSLFKSHEAIALTCRNLALWSWSLLHSNVWIDTKVKITLTVDKWHVLIRILVTVSICKGLRRIRQEPFGYVHEWLAILGHILKEWHWYFIAFFSPEIYFHVDHKQIWFPGVAEYSPSFTAIHEKNIVFGYSTLFHVNNFKWIPNSLETMASIRPGTWLCLCIGICIHKQSHMTL